MARLFQCSLVSRLYGQDALNQRAYYAEQGTAEELATLWTDFLIPALLALMTTELEMQYLQIIELLVGDDTHVVDLTGTFGNGQTDPLPKFDAVGLLFPVATNVTRAGSNRFMGVTEGQTTEGELNPTWAAAWSAIGDGFSASVDINGNVYYPSVIRDMDLRYLINPIVGSVLQGVTTQNSRKRYTQGAVGLPSKGANQVQVIAPALGTQAAINLLAQIVREPVPLTGANALFPRYEQKTGIQILNDLP